MRLKVLKTKKMLVNFLFFLRYLCAIIASKIFFLYLNFIFTQQTLKLTDKILQLQSEKAI